MKHCLYFFILANALFANEASDTWILPISIHYNDGHIDTAWTGFSFNLSPLNPINPKNILFFNKMRSDSLWISDSLYSMPDGFKFIYYERFILLNHVSLIEIIVSESMSPIELKSGINCDMILHGKKGKTALEKKIIKQGKFVIEDDSGCCASHYHIYIYNPKWTVKQIQILLKTEQGKEQIQKAEKKGEILVLEEVFY